MHFIIKHAFVTIEIMGQVLSAFVCVCVFEPVLNGISVLYKYSLVRVGVTIVPLSSLLLEVHDLFLMLVVTLWYKYKF